MTGVSLFSAGNLSPGEREDRGNRWVLAAFAVIGLLNGYLPALTDRLDFWTFGGDGVRWLGVVLFTAGGAVRLWPVFVLGRRFSGLVAIQPGHTLVTTGIYSVIRHPSYLGLLVSSLGWGLAFRSGVGILLAVLSLVPVIGRIRAEEVLLHSEFGAEYRCLPRPHIAAHPGVLLTRFPPGALRTRCAGTTHNAAFAWPHYR